MISKTTPRFRKMLVQLPPDLQKPAVIRYRQWAREPVATHPHFKEIRYPIWSVRINQNYRAVGKRLNDDLIVWFWVGPHGPYDKLIRG